MRSSMGYADSSKAELTALRRATAAGLGVISLALGSLTASAQSNNLTDLGPYAPGLGINNSGDVVLQNYLYSSGTMTAFPANFTGAGINTIGQVVGSVGLNCQNVNLDAGGGCAFATYVSGVLTTYPIYDGVLDPAVGNQAQSMNANGVIVGDWTFTHGEGYPLVLTNGVFSALQFPGSTCGGNVATTAGVAYAINDAGQIAGMLPYDPQAGGTCESHAFLVSNGIYSDIGPGYAYALNASGQVTGISYILGGPPNYYQTSPEVFRYGNGTTTRLGTLAGDDSSEGRAINASGQIVGDSWLSTAPPTVPKHAFLYNGALQDLNALVLPTDPLQPYVTLTDGRGINDNGLVVANGVDSRDGLQHVYLLQLPLITVAPGSLTFASQVAGTVSAAQPVTLTNVGAAALALGTISTTGNFAQTNDCGSSLAPNGSCMVMVTFNPMASGTLTGTLAVVAAGTPVAVPLSGSGAKPPMSPSGGGGGGALDLLSLICLIGISALRWSRRGLTRRGAARQKLA